MRRWLLTGIMVCLIAGMGAGAIPAPPHSVHGAITDGGDPVPGRTVEVRHDGAALASTSTDSSGQYSLTVPYNSSYSGATMPLFVAGDDTGKGITFTSGASERIDHQGDYLPDSSGGNGGGGSGGGGGGGGSIALPEDNATSPRGYRLLLEEGRGTITIDELEPDQLVRIRIVTNRSDQAFRLLTFRTDTRAANESITVETGTDSTPFGIAPPAGPVYRYMSVTLNRSLSITDANITFHVEQDWLGEHRRNASAVRLYRYTGGSRGQVTVTEQDQDTATFNASPPGFSVFAIALPEREPETPDIDLEDWASPPTGPVTRPPEPPSPPIILPLLVILLVASIVTLAYSEYSILTDHGQFKEIGEEAREIEDDVLEGIRKEGQHIHQVTRDKLPEPTTDMLKDIGRNRTAEQEENSVDESKVISEDVLQEDMEQRQAGSDKETSRDDQETNTRERSGSPAQDEAGEEGGTHRTDASAVVQRILDREQDTANRNRETDDSTTDSTRDTGDTRDRSMEDVGASMDQEATMNDTDQENDNEDDGAQLSWRED